MPLGALIGGVMNLIGSGVNNDRDDQRQAAALRAQKEENQLNREWQERMWQEHESPQAQAQNLRSIGLNPAGQVGSQSVGTASTSSLPTPNPSTIGSGISRAGELIASGLHAHKALKLQREQFNQSVTEQNRRFLLDLSAAELNAEEKRAIINSRLAELESLQLDNDTKRLNKQMLEDFVNAGGNTFSDASALTQAQTNYAKAQTEYQNLMSKIANEQSDEQKNVLRAQAESLKASAQQAYANAILADAQTQVAKSSKLKIDSETQIGKDKAAQDAALYELQLVEQSLINQGLMKDNVRKEIDNTRERIRNGDVRTFGELGAHIWYNLDDILTFM